MQLNIGGVKVTLDLNPYNGTLKDFNNIFLGCQIENNVGTLTCLKSSVNTFWGELNLELKSNDKNEGIIGSITNQIDEGFSVKDLVKSSTNRLFTLFVRCTVKMSLESVSGFEIEGIINTETILNDLNKIRTCAEPKIIDLLTSLFQVK